MTATMTVLPCTFLVVPLTGVSLPPRAGRRGGQWPVAGLDDAIVFSLFFPLSLELICSTVRRVIYSHPLLRKRSSFLLFLLACPSLHLVVLVVVAAVVAVLVALSHLCRVYGAT